MIKAWALRNWMAIAATSIVATAGGTVAVVSMTTAGIVADGVTDNHAVIQAALDAAAASPTEKTVRLPAGDILISKPLRIEGEHVRLIGSEDGPTKLFGTFSGFYVVAKKPAPFPQTFGPSLATGPGQAFKLKPGTGGQAPIWVTTEEGIDMRGASELTLRYFFKRNTPTSAAGVHCFFGGSYGHRQFQALSMWDWFGGLKVFWGGVGHDIPGVAQEIGKTYYIAITFKSSRLKVWVGEPGQSATLVKDVLTPSATCPWHGGGVEVLSFGYDTRGPNGDQASWGGPDSWIDGWELADVARHDAPFVCPEAKPVPDASTRLSVNFETENPFVLGRGKNGKMSYILPFFPVEHQGGVVLENIQFMGGHGGGSGPCLVHAIVSNVKNLGIVQSYAGYTWRGDTYGCSFDGIRGYSRGLNWVQGNQGMMTSARNLNLGILGRGIICYISGAVGGVYQGLYLSPGGPCLASLYIAETNDVNVYSGQVDDEGQAGDVGSVVILDRRAWAKFYGFQLGRHTPGAIIDSFAQSSAHLDGSWLYSLQGSEPQIRFHDTVQPIVPFTINGMARHPTTIQLTNKPEWIGPILAP